MTVELWKTIFDWGTVILLGLTFAFGLGALVTGNILSERQEGKLRQFDQDLTQAKTRLAEQQKRAATAEKELLQLKEHGMPRILSKEQFDALQVLRGRIKAVNVACETDAETVILRKPANSGPPKSGD